MRSCSCQRGRPSRAREASTSIFSLDPGIATVYAFGEQDGWAYLATEYVHGFSLRDLLQTGGRTLAQGALGWILARSSIALPVPGFKTEAQVSDNLGANERGPLPVAVMAEIDGVLAGFGE